MVGFVQVHGCAAALPKRIYGVIKFAQYLTGF